VEVEQPAKPVVFDVKSGHEDEARTAFMEYEDKQRCPNCGNEMGYLWADTDGEDGNEDDLTLHCPKCGHEEKVKQ
jgi:predicted RNA-binding Zn-ribbon protein involved in translation (DUF1610 family)